jgi:DNA-binding GntR family transcriptional regulator
MMAPHPSRARQHDLRYVDVVDQLAGGFRTVGQMVHAVLREAITTGAFAPGEWLRQETLAEAIGVSRIPVRTALLQLESDGLVVFHPHRGARVRTMSAAQIDEIYQLRLLLESHALRLSMARMSPDRLHRLHRLATVLDAHGDGGPFLDARVAFYREVYDHPAHPLLLGIIEDLRGHVGRYLLSFRVDQRHAGRHLGLVESLSAGDLPAAESWLRAHLEEVRAGIRALASGSDVDGTPTGDPHIREPTRPRLAPVTVGLDADSASRAVDRLHLLGRGARGRIEDGTAFTE